MIVSSCNTHGTPIEPTSDLDNKLWWPHQLYSGPGSTGHMPIVGDLIVSFEHNGFLKVNSVNAVTREWTAVPWQLTEVEGAPSTGNYGNNAPESQRVYIDTSKTPATLRVDPRWKVSGSDNQYIKVFRGTDVSENGEVISGYFLNNIYQGENIPLHTTSIEYVDNKTIKAPVPGSCTKEVDNGELVTIVTYSDVVGVSLISYAYVVKTNLVMAVDNPARQIIDVKLKSPFISNSDDGLLMLPINIPIDDIPLEAEVIYSDGRVSVPVDGTRAKLNGLRNAGAYDAFYISSIAGDELDLTLVYSMASSETYVGDNVADGKIMKDYRATTLAVDGAYSVKLFVKPRWLDSARGWRLEYYLYNLERGNLYDATAHVTLAPNSAFFDPLLFGVKQQLAVTVNLAEVSPEYVSHIHPQSFNITLIGSAISDNDSFIIEYVPGQETYGKDIRGAFTQIDVNNSSVDITCGAISKSEWLEKMYLNTHPLYDRRAEDGPVTPTHFELVTPNGSYLKLVDDWVNPFSIDYVVTDGETLELRWICRTPSDDLQLGMSPIVMHLS